ncbi:hypothetical protein, partial [Erwinia sp. OLMDSP33]|uniref:hypothetical protein n=2 Tax=Erwinia TaxID=551 RepID=UPI0018EC989F
MALQFNYTVVQGTCTVAADPTVVWSAADLATVNGAVGQNWVMLAPKTLTVTLSNCNGAADASTRPALKLTGTTATDGSTNRQKYIITAGTNTTGFGVVVSGTVGTNPANGATNDLVAMSGGGGLC